MVGMKLFSTQSQLHKEIHQQMQCSLNLIKYNPATKPVGITGHVIRLKKKRPPQISFSATVQLEGIDLNVE